MKQLLVLFCVITGVFGGGCAVVGITLSGGGMNYLTLIPLAVFVFNMLVILAVLGWKKPWAPAFYALAIVDFGIAALVCLSMLVWGAQAPEILGWASLLAGAFAVKGFLTWRFIRNV